MKTTLTCLTVALSLMLWFGTNLLATQSAQSIIVTMTEDNHDIYEESPRGLRMLSAPIALTIDFSTLSISCNRAPLVLSYELWDETGDNMIASYTNDYEMVAFISSQTGVYQLKLFTEESTYIGYIEL